MNHLLVGLDGSNTLLQEYYAPRKEGNKQHNLDSWLQSHKSLDKVCFWEVCSEELFSCWPNQGPSQPPGVPMAKKQKSYASHGLMDL